MRCFFAIELPVPLRERLVALQEALAQACPRASWRWTRPEQLHLTAKFLGELPDEEALAAAAEAARTALAEQSALALELTRAGSFGGRRPQVLWMGVGGPDAAGLGRLVERLECALEPLGHPPEGRAFRPHVTIARRRRGRGGRGRGDARLAETLAGLAPLSLPFRAAELVLFESSYGQRAGPVAYTARARIALDSR